MEIDRIPFSARIMIIIGIGVALAVSLDNIAIGIGVATLFLAGLVLRKNKVNDTPGEDHE